MIDEEKNLKHIHIEGYKSIEQLDLPMERLNILIGANGAGKSNFISLFTFLSQLSHHKLRQYVAQAGGAEGFFYFGSKATEQIKLAFQLGINRYSVTFVPNFDDDSLVFAKEECSIETSNKSWSLSPKQGESGFGLAVGSRSPVVHYTQTYLQQCRVYHFHDTSDQAKFKKRSPLDQCDSLEKNAANLAPFLYRLKTGGEAERKAYQQILLAVQAVAPFIHDFHLEPSGVEGDQHILFRWVHQQHDSPFSAQVLSDGTARFICLATLFLQPVALRPATLILDEPELGLHPAALGLLAEIIQVASKETQVICSTQSVTFANQFAPGDFIVVDTDKGASTFKRLDPKEFEGWLKDYGMGDIWGKNLIGGRPRW